jgi:UTP--glucose-1-phosphate uridylyltransferase
MLTLCRDVQMPYTPRSRPPGPLVPCSSGYTIPDPAVIISHAVITAAAPAQRALPLQTLVDQEGHVRPLLSFLVEEALRAGIEEICIVVNPEDTVAYQSAAGEHADRLTFVAQEQPRGYGHAIWCAGDFVKNVPFLHMIGDHVYVSGEARGCAAQVVAVAEDEECAVSGVQPTRESLLPYFGAVGGHRVSGTKDLYVVERVAEKPTPTEAEQTLLVPGLRAGHYLCFFGLHVFTPTVMELLDEAVRDSAGRGGIQLSPVLDAVAGREKYLALEATGRRYPLDARYGLLTAQLALALSGSGREEVLTILGELLVQRELDTARSA